jgi:TPR repeat protein
MFFFKQGNNNGCGDAKDCAEALRWFKLAAAQGLGQALCNVGEYYEVGYIVAADRADAIRWYERAAAARFPLAAAHMKRLGTSRARNAPTAAGLSGLLSS